MDDASDERETTEICGVRENTRSELLNQSEESEQSDCENTNLGQRVSTTSRIADYLALFHLAVLLLQHAQSLRLPTLQ
jgi:hypothetical protein